jgi:hypothetical protein
LIEEFYEELLTTLGRVEQRPRARQDNLQRLIHAHLIYIRNALAFPPGGA